MSADMTHERKVTTRDGVEEWWQFYHWHSVSADVNRINLSYLQGPPRPTNPVRADPYEDYSLCKIATSGSREVTNIAWIWTVMSLYAPQWFLRPGETAEIVIESADTSWVLLANDEERCRLTRYIAPGLGSTLDVRLSGITSYHDMGEYVTCFRLTNEVLTPMVAAMLGGIGGIPPETMPMPRAFNPYLG